MILTTNPAPPRRLRGHGKKRRRRSFARRLKRTTLVFRFMAALVGLFIRLAHGIGRSRAEKVFRYLFRFLGPMLSEHRTAARNIAGAFPDKSEEEHRRILRGCWENVALVFTEFVFLEELAAEFDPQRPDAGKVTVEGAEQFAKLRDDDKPAVIFSAHLANWEILGVVAAKYGLDLVIPYHAPANIYVADDVLERRSALMGRLVRDRRGAAFEIAAAMDGGAHLGLLVDQRLNRALSLPFLGRPAWTNPLAAKLARQFDCPVHGARAIRLPGGRLHLELTPEIAMPRDDDGLIDVGAAMTRINEIVAQWVREYPEQWLWLHDRWLLHK